MNDTLKQAAQADNIELPNLPELGRMSWKLGTPMTKQMRQLYDDSQMEDYARQAVLADRARRGAPITTPEHDAKVMDAARYQKLKARAKQNRAYDVYGHGAHWNIGFHSDDGRLDFDAAVDALKSTGADHAK